MTTHRTRIQRNAAEGRLLKKMTASLLAVTTNDNIEDNDNLPKTGYEAVITTHRPLPGGTYKFKTNANTPVTFPATSSQRTGLTRGLSQ